MGDNNVSSGLAGWFTSGLLLRRRRRFFGAAGLTQDLSLGAKGNNNMDFYVRFFVFVFEQVT